MLATPRPIDKRQALRQQGVLNPHPEAVQDVLFRRYEFFDACDLVQVKYEMLRRVQIDQQPIGQAAAAFGFSRPAFYQAQARWARHGLFGLIPQKRGPRGAHKLTAAVWDFLEKTRAADPRLRPGALAQRVEEHFGVRIHPHSLARGLRTHQKKRSFPTRIPHPRPRRSP